jgi:hypothetical protein
MTPGSNPLADVALGDIIQLPDRRSLTARARVTLPTPSGTMAGFVIVGEMEALLSVPAFSANPILIYDPVPELPRGATTGRVACEGATNYWAPHLPALQGAMGEILYRVVELRGSINPIVIIYRGAEVIVFIMSSSADAQDINVLTMRRFDTSDIEVTRHAGIVTTPERVYVPDFEEEPARVPEQVPTAPERQPVGG